MKDYISLYETQKTVEYFGLILTIPEVSGWLATDLDGWVWYHSHKPKMCNNEWLFEYDCEACDCSTMESVRLCKVNLNDIDWTTTLKEIK